MLHEYQNLNLLGLIRVRADAVVFGTCLYIGAAAFIIEFQGSHSMPKKCKFLVVLTTI